MEKIRIGIVGYGNIGKGVEKAVLTAPDMELKAVFTKRDPVSIQLSYSSAPVLPFAESKTKTDEIDVMILCGGSKTDLIGQGPELAALFNTVDSFDIHSKIPEYLKSVDAAAQKTTAIISCGWDPGLFSMMRAISESVLPDGNHYTFWGHGVSQGHSVAVRSVEGVKTGVQYSVPLADAVESVRRGERPVLTPAQKQLRECFVVAEPGADKSLIEEKIKTMPDYFADYNTIVHFITQDEFDAGHTGMPHGGLVLHSGATGSNECSIEFSLKMESNPEFTGSIMTAYARAAYRMAKAGLYGAKTVLDVPLCFLSEKTREILIKELL